MVSGAWCVLHKYSSSEKDGDDDEEEELGYSLSVKLGDEVVPHIKGGLDP